MEVTGSNSTQFELEINGTTYGRLTLIQLLRKQSKFITGLNDGNNTEQMLFQWQAQVSGN
ncbi:MAG: hypothetical protein H6554_04095 [Chitinophagales bacterium]|nr:hypothetical protein [Chitinophagales bacterium]